MNYIAFGCGCERIALIGDTRQGSYSPPQHLQSTSGKGNLGKVLYKALTNCMGEYKAVPAMNATGKAQQTGSNTANKGGWVQATYNDRPLYKLVDKGKCIGLAMGMA